ncbi:unnamed protein product (macronuclear) [Paramecium tetraurelia]|uniref:Mannose-P-dolichol utilization defect 1 protein homolog n=1 Tax=Paramecium tetraurelia TaxID=5888 RepID=A0CK53_PARTE|nr:uncharacterized protein GSPATT00000883001 [Paramecium tetraurelia]CAK71170.1 unnamed protein product [Paramecium tetraurelia]|eukprot:XP_001438567.1 hypothetical protein (macronuclear) [Paramecium tetraurelia strain d4-2]
MTFIYNLISYGIVFGAIFNQLPQIYKIYKSKSIQGISFSSIYTEVLKKLKQTLMLVFNIAYNMHVGTSFLLYGENVILYIGYIVVILQFRYYSQKQSDYQRKLSFLGIISVLFLFQIVPSIIFKHSIYINMILLFLSKWPQIQMNYQRQSTGELAFLTHLQNQAGAIPRALTIFAESSNELLYCLAILDNGLVLIITLQFVVYWKAREISKKL